MRGYTGKRQRLGKMRTQVTHDLLELARLVVRIRTHPPPMQQPILGADRNNAQQRRLDRQLAAQPRLQPGAHNLREQGAHFLLPRLTGTQAGRKPQPPLRQRREQLVLRLVAARKLQKVRRKHKRTELVFFSRRPNLMQFLARDEKDVTMHPLIYLIGNGQRYLPRFHRDDLHFGMPMVWDKVAVVGLAAVECGIDLERKRERAVLFFFTSCSVHDAPPKAP